MTLEYLFNPQVFRNIFHKKQRSVNTGRYVSFVTQCCDCGHCFW